MNTTSCLQRNMSTSPSMGRVPLVVKAMNDHATSLATQGTYNEAIQVYTKALTFVRQLLLGLNSMHPSNNCLNGHELVQDHESSGKSTLLREEASPPPAMVLGEFQQARTTAQNPFVFSHFILSSEQHHTTVLADFLDTSSFTLIFNMALCHHLKTIEASKFSPDGAEAARDDWLTALKLYELAFEMQASESVEVSLVFILGLVNNMSHLHLQLKNQQQSMRCLSILLTSLMHYVVTVRGNANLGVVCDAEDPLLEAYLPAFFGAISHLVFSETVCAEIA
eukprot:Nitzschia sp. Nitz4//scaffold98_size77359//7031//7870//NITZ4_005534-RA/size77359-processed-gene-0.29-mRNA-1//-1//CDS//3329560715//6470//frame0